MHQLIEQVQQVDPRVKINLFRAAARPLQKPERPDREDNPTEEGETMSPNTIESVYFDKPGWKYRADARHRPPPRRRGWHPHSGRRHDSGETRRQVAEQFQGYNVVVVSHSTGFQEPNQQELTPENRAAIEQLGGKIVTTAHAFGGVNRGVRIKLGTYEIDEIIAHTLRLFGQGTKVACEIALMAADAGLIRTDEDAMHGGSGRGADTAVVLRPTNAMRFFDLRVRRVLCKPQEF